MPACMHEALRHECAWRGGGGGGGGAGGGGSVRGGRPALFPLEIDDTTMETTCMTAPHIRRRLIQTNNQAANNRL
jgi:hypothetical protein